MSETDYYVGVDVGTGSVRALVVDRKGNTVASSIQEIKTWRDPQDYRIFEQSTDDIWQAVGIAIKACIQSSHISPSSIKGLGFDATCSLAVTDFNGDPIVVTNGETLGQQGERNVILWADHRAVAEADLINATGSPALDYVGGKISLEMEIPKILWLKNRMHPSRFCQCQFFDLPDFLTYRATKNNTRSVCSLTCKCSFLPNTGWNKDFFKQIGLEELHNRDFAQIGAKEGEEVLIAGMPVGGGLSKAAADDLGLVEGTAVGSALIDAYAGWLGTIAASVIDESGTLSSIPKLDESAHRIAVIAGTSTCHIVQSPQGIFVEGVWGPYKDATIKGWWMNEGGQSSTGQLIDFVLTTHPAYNEAVKLSQEGSTTIHQVLEDTLERLRKQNNVDSLTELTKDLHIYPDFHGNRSPIADPRMRGWMTGLELDHSIVDMAKRYHATLMAIALQTRHIIDALNIAGHHITSIYMSGGQAKNTGLMQLFADVCDMPVVLPKNSGDAVVLGAAMLGRFAANAGESGTLKDEQSEKIWEIMVEMTPPGSMVRPKASEKEKRLLQAKYKIFLETIEIQKRWRAEMEAATNS
ncbi:hypothetical protein CVT24_012596 [Panaeolus cyanescens]|uniref:Carbohydrate kinase FGGY C-terminal domain-containing protein n=1 Tax=Panaeolus cyanescens TaxID=181874 RepID=A0A409YJX4_9AGAR|nr:hypothetical protein CVT24_012596 [Panaeolus cyanescens]